MGAMVQDKSETKRYIVGIDLGTTNSAVAFIDTEKKNYTVEDFSILQITAPNESDTRNLFPSFHYEAAATEISGDSFSLPWSPDSNRIVTGMYARDHGALVPGRVVASAKSWLSHSGVDRTAALLPWHAAPDVEKISPIDATSRYLYHMRMAWNSVHTDDLLENQDVVITVPASFDEIARELTVEAAARAGLNAIVLLEEPQAAFYCWIDAHRNNWEKLVGAGQKILICDIGGGTTDFTLIQVRAEDGAVRFHRVAVGDHLILGGDNLDLALAYHIERVHLEGKKLTPRQFGALVRNCQKAKEMLLGDKPPERYTISIPGSGTSLIGGSIQIEIGIDEVNRVLLEGFFPAVSLNDRPMSRQSGFQEFGLPYAPDPAVTKYLAQFLVSHRAAAAHEMAATAHDPARPDIILFNGGVLTSSAIRKRILSAVEQWFTESDKQEWKPQLFENEHPELAVSRGAAYFGLVRRGIGVRISAGLARSYYIGVQTELDETRAFCLAPAGLQEGATVDLSGRQFDLLIRQPVEFPIFVSSTRTIDTPGELIEIDKKEIYSLPPIRTVLRSGKKLEADTVRVTLNARLTEIGTLDLWCAEVNGTRSWKLQFDIRSATRTEIAAHKGAGEQAGVIDAQTLVACRNLIESVFGLREKRTVPLENIVKLLEAETGIEKNNWPPSFLRAIWEYFLEFVDGRKIDPAYEMRWLNLLGFSLRPGYGVAVDDWRVKQTWLLFQQGVVHSKNQGCRSEWWILWRRVAGGLTPGQQKALANPVLPFIVSRKNSDDKKKKVIDQRLGNHELAEMIRLVASLELLPSDLKKQVGNCVISLVRGKDELSEAAVWAAGRLGARVPLYGPLNELVDSEVVEEWLKHLLVKGIPSASLYFSLMQLARKTDDRHRDISDSTRVAVVEKLRNCGAPAHFIELVESGGGLDQSEQDMMFGEQLPRGLKVV